jgi:hypothetical protein
MTPADASALPTLVAAGSLALRPVGRAGKESKKRISGEFYESI